MQIKTILLYILVISLGVHIVSIVSYMYLVKHIEIIQTQINHNMNYINHCISNRSFCIYQDKDIHLNKDNIKSIYQ